jgi:hypothetical protein
VGGSSLAASGGSGGTSGRRVSAPTAHDTLVILERRGTVEGERVTLTACAFYAQSASQTKIVAGGTVPRVSDGHAQTTQDTLANSTPRGDGRTHVCRHRAEGSRALGEPNHQGVPNNTP